MPGGFVDAEGVAMAWLRSVPGLTGPGSPLPLGVHLNELRGASAGTFARLARVGGGNTWLTEAASDSAHMTASVFGPNRAAAAAGAVALANTLSSADRTQPVAAGARITAVDNITGPTSIPEDEGAHYLVDFDLYATPA